MKYLSPQVIGISIFLLLSVAPLSLAEQSAPEDNIDFGSVEERRLFMVLQEEKTKLDKEKESMEEEKKELKKVQSEVDKKLEQLQALRIQLERLLEEKDAVELRKIKELSLIYQKMSPAKAAQVLAQLDDQLAIAILDHMKEKSAAKILNNMNRDRAAALTTDFSVLKE